MGPSRIRGGTGEITSTANYTKALGDTQKLGFRVLFGRNDFYSSGQIPLDLVDGGQLDRFGYIDPSDGGKSGSLPFRRITAKLGRTATRFRRMVSLDDHCSTCTPISRSF